MPSCARELEAQGQKFSTETDTETVAQLLDLLLAQGACPGRGGEGGLCAAGRRLCAWR